MTPEEAIEARVAEFRAALEACAAEGFDPAEVTVTFSRYGSRWIQVGDIPEAKAVAILARLADGELRRTDTETASSYVAGSVRVFAERHPDAPAIQPEGAPDGD